MRALFLLLVLANVGFYAWWRYGPPADAEDPAPLARQIEPEKLKVVPASELPPAAAAKKAVSCIEWGSFTLADVARAEQALEPLALGPRLAHRRQEEATSWWVFIPSLGSRQAALRKVAELKDLGVQDYYIMQDEGEHRWALSLGLFRSEEAAQARLAALRAQGLRNARLAPRDPVAQKVWLQVKGVDAPLQARLKEIARQVGGSELKDCP